jgi:hypothetical protein
MSPARPAQPHDTNIVFVHGWPERKAEKERIQEGQELEHSSTRELEKNK